MRPRFSPIASYRSIAIAILLALNFACSRQDDGDLVTIYRTPRPWLLGGNSLVSKPAADDAGVYFCGGYGWDKRMKLLAIDNDGGQRWGIDIGKTCSNIAATQKSILIEQTWSDTEKRVWLVDKANGVSQVLNNVALVAATDSCAYLRDDRHHAIIRYIGAAQRQEIFQTVKKPATATQGSAVVVSGDDSLVIMDDCNAKPRQLARASKVLSIGMSSTHVCYITQIERDRAVGRLFCINRQGGQPRDYGSAWGYGSSPIFVTTSGVFFRDSKHLVRMRLDSGERVVFETYENANFNEVFLMEREGLYLNNFKQFRLVDKHNWETRWMRLTVGRAGGAAVNEKRLFIVDDGDGTLRIYRRPVDPT